MPREYSDFALVLLYSLFSEECYAAGWIDATPNTLAYFRQWLASNEIEHAELEDYEIEMLRLYHESEAER